MRSPNFFVGIRLRGAPATPPSGKRLRRDLEQWLAALDPDDIEHRLASHGLVSLPLFRWSHDGWEIEIIPIPKPDAIRESPGVRPVGITMPEIKEINHPSIEKAVRAKGTKYGKLDLPYIVAVNVDDPFRFLQNLEIVRRHTLDELFGREVRRDVLQLDGTIDRYRETERSCAWYGPDRLRNTRVCAALVATGVDPWTVGDHIPVLIHNPWATRPFSPDLWLLPQWVPNFDEGQVEERPGKSTAEVVSLAN